MAFLDKSGLQSLTNKLVDGENIRVSSSLGTTVKNVIDNIERECENILTPNTMKIENRVNEFKIGKGRDVNVVEDVETGYSEIELQGKTWHNIHSLSEIEGTNNATVTNIDLNKLSFEVKYSNNTVGNTSNNRAVLFGDFKNKIKPSTKYTFIYKCILLENPHGESCQLDIAIDCWGQGLGLSPITYNTGDTFFVRKVNTSPSQENLNTISTTINFINSKGKNTKWKIEDFMILEGDHTQSPVEELPNYFEGIKSSFEDGVVDVEVQGKNLFDGSYRFGYLQGGDTPLYIDRDSGATRSVILKVKPNTTYNISKEYSIRNTIGLFKDYPINNTPYTPIPLNINGTRVNTGDNNYMVVYVSNESEEPWLQVEEGFVATPYEPYYKKKISFNIGEPLKSLPNGVCDEIRNNNGQWEFVRKVGKVILDGNEKEIWLNNIRDGRTQFVLHNVLLTNPSLSIYQNGNAWCDTLPVIPNDNPIRAIWVYEKNNIVIQLPVEIADTIDKLRVWLSQNPTTVYYELATPTITPIEPIKFETLPLGYISINSEIAPISHHTVQLNRAGQIEIGIVEIASLKSRVEKLENFYDQYFLETQHKLSILNMDYILESEEI